MSGNGQLRHRLGRAEALVEERLANTIPLADVVVFLGRLDAEIKALVPPERHSEIPAALERAAGVIPTTERDEL